MTKRSIARSLQRCALAATLLGAMAACKQDADQAAATEETVAATGEAAGEAAAKIPGPKVTRGKTYSHPVGFSFWYPGDWKVTPAEDGLQLIPPDPKANADGPLEVYMLTADSAAGISKPDDPRVISYLDKALRSIAPFLKKSSAPEPLTTSHGQGAVLDWAGHNPKNIPILARAYVTLLKGYGVALVAMGERAQIEARDPQARQIFTTFGFGEGERDAALVGSWHLLSTSAISNNSPFETAWTRAQAVNEQTSSLKIRGDGTWTRTDKRHMLVGAAGIWLEDKSSSSASGTWSAGGGKLYMIWKDKSWEEYSYQLDGNRLRLASDKQGEVWKRGG